MDGFPTVNEYSIGLDAGPGVAFDPDCAGDVDHLNSRLLTGARTYRLAFAVVGYGHSGQTTVTVKVVKDGKKVDEMVLDVVLPPDPYEPVSFTHGTDRCHFREIVGEVGMTGGRTNNGFNKGTAFYASATIYSGRPVLGGGSMLILKELNTTVV